MFEEVSFGPGWEKLGLESGRAPRHQVKARTGRLIHPIQHDEGCDKHALFHVLPIKKSVGSKCETVRCSH